MGKFKTKIDGQIIWINLARNWLHQAVTYMDSGEKKMRLTMEFVEILIIFNIGQLLFSHSVISLLIGFVFVHTFNWIFNGNIWALLIFSFPRLKNVGEKETCDYLNKIADRLLARKSIAGVLIFGSITRRKWHEKSDIDLRILRNPGMWNLFCSYALTMKERFIAAISRQPLDMFLADDLPFLRKMRPDETPIFLVKNSKKLDMAYPGNHPINIKKLRERID